MYNITPLIMGLFLGVIALAADTEKDELQVAQEGYLITVIDFKEGDQIKLFEAETGIHVLSKSYGTVDLSQLPNGKYVLENSAGKTTFIERCELALWVAPPLDDRYMVAADVTPLDADTEAALEDVWKASNPETQFLEITREDNLITVMDFEDGDTLKLFEIKDAVHILSKTTRTIDLSQLPVGHYALRNNKGKLAIIEKYEDAALMIEEKEVAKSLDF